MRKYLSHAAAVAALLVIGTSSSYALTCKEAQYYYQEGLTPKAYATSDNGHCGYSVNRDAGARDIDTAKFRAKKYCEEKGGRNCRILRAE
jgi:hypothetical protein